MSGSLGGGDERPDRADAGQDPEGEGNPPGNRAKPAPRNGATAAAAIRGPLKTPLSRA